MSSNLLLQELGKGNFARVTLKKKTSDCPGGALADLPEMFASKAFKKSTLKRQEIHDVIEEFLLMTSFLKGEYNPNVVKLHMMLQSSEYMYILMEAVPGGDLGKLIASVCQPGTKNQRAMNEQDAKSITYQILSGVQYIHSHDIIHLDLKPENVLLGSREPPFYAKITDFGLSEVLCSRKEKRSKFPGSPLYVPPEIWQAQVTYNEKVDLWAVGVMMLEMLTANLPWSKEHCNSAEEVSEAVQSFKGLLCVNQLDGANARATLDLLALAHASRECADECDLELGLQIPGDVVGQRILDAFKEYSVPPHAQDMVSHLLQHIGINRPAATRVLHQQWFADINDFETYKLPLELTERSRGPEDCTTPEYQHLYRLCQSMRADIIGHEGWLPNMHFHADVNAETGEKDRTLAFLASSHDFVPVEADEQDRKLRAEMSERTTKGSKDDQPKPDSGCCQII